jgi:hypothetical protein
VVRPRFDALRDSSAALCDTERNHRRAGFVILSDRKVCAKNLAETFRIRGTWDVRPAEKKAHPPFDRPVEEVRNRPARIGDDSATTRPRPRKKCTVMERILARPEGFEPRPSDSVVPLRVVDASTAKPIAPRSTEPTGGATACRFDNTLSAKAPCLPRLRCAVHSPSDFAPREARRSSDRYHPERPRGQVPSSPTRAY